MPQAAHVADNSFRGQDVQTSLREPDSDAPTPRDPLLTADQQTSDPVGDEELTPFAAVDSIDAGARFIRGGLVRVITFGVGLMLSLAAVPLMIRHLGPVGYGYFGTVSAIVFIIAGFTEAGLTTLATREYANRPHAERTALLRNMIGLRVTATIVAVLGVSALTAVTGSPREISLGILLAGAGLVVTIVGENLTIPLLVDLRIPSVAFLDLLRLAVLAAVYLGLVIVGANVLPFLGATLLSGTVLLLATMTVLRGSVAIRPAFDLTAWRGLLVRTLPYAMAAAVGVIYFREALILVQYLSTTHQAGYYAAAFRIVEVLATLPWMVGAASLPIFARAARNDPERTRYALQRLFDVALLVGAWFSLSVFVGARLGIAVVAGSQFRPAVGVLQIQGLALVATFVVATLAPVLLSLEAYRTVMWSNAVAVAVATLVGVAAIPHGGAHGAAIAPTAAEGVLAVAYAIGLVRHDRRLRLSLRVLPRVALAAAVAAALAFTVTDSEVVRLAIVTVVYFGVAFVLRAIPYELWNALLRRPPNATHG